MFGNSPLSHCKEETKCDGRASNSISMMNINCGSCLFKTLDRFKHKWKWSVFWQLPWIPEHETLTLTSYMSVVTANTPGWWHSHTACLEELATRRQPSCVHRHRCLLRKAPKRRPRKCKCLFKHPNHRHKYLRTRSPTKGTLFLEKTISFVAFREEFQFQSSFYFAKVLCKPVFSLESEPHFLSDAKEAQPHKTQL